MYTRGPLRQPYDFQMDIMDTLQWTDRPRLYHRRNGDSLHFLAFPFVVVISKIQESSSGNSREGSVTPPPDAHLSINNNVGNTVSAWATLGAAPNGNSNATQITIEVKQKTPRKQKKSQILAAGNCNL